MMVNSARKTGKMPPFLDRVAVLLSGLCLLHCLALPFLLLSLPALSELARGHLHAQMLVIAIPVSVFALAFGFRRHANFYVLGFGILGMLLLIVGGTIAHRYYGLAADRSFTLVGAVVLAVTHYINSRLVRHCRSDGETVIGT